MPVAESAATSSIAQALLAEFEIQAPLTRKFLERLPEEKLSWRPHAKSMTAGQLALHLAAVPGGVVRAAAENPHQVPDFASFPQPAGVEEILKAFDEGIAAVREGLPQFDDAAMGETWHLAKGDRVLNTMPRAAFLRDILLSHWYQHRGQFSVYLRLLDVAVPSTWGPSADEVPAFLQ
ncbi:MAG TPA: DinB family protein [Terracidiphilus sp.]|nr:DinB family protein [Terracidiphilus sp.]